MKNSGIYALDFDGVICDSAIETGISGWKAAGRIWDDMLQTSPDMELLNRFRSIRPMLETGYEAILIVRLLYLGEKPDAIVSDYVNKTHDLMTSAKLDIHFLKQLFGATRDRWIAESLDDWINMNPLYQGVAKKLKKLETQSVWYIVTTKQQRFVTEILKTHQIEIAADRIFGSERAMSKEDMLLTIMDRHPQDDIILVEDRLATLLDVAKNDKLQGVKLYLADWGYNTQYEREGIASGVIELLTLENFLR